MTGFYRDGVCRTSPEDFGIHTVCAILTDEFLEFSQKRGNDLITAVPEFNFPGLKAGDKWCLCALRWKEAHEAGCAPKIVAQATSSESLKIIDKETLLKYKV